MSRKLTIISLTVLSSALLSVPFLVPGTGWLSLIAFVPLLWAEDMATGDGVKGFCRWHYLCFVLWNAATTFWICNATVGGGVFAILANALQMSLIFGLFRWSRKWLDGALPYIFLAFAWIAWERWYLTSAQISWPWLVLGNAFARTTGWIQWYEYTGTLGGSLLVWAANLSVFGILESLAGGRWTAFNPKAKSAALLGTLALFVAPPLVSGFLKRESCDETLDVVVAQPNIDPYNKFGGMTQEEQNELLLSQFVDIPDSVPVLLVAPETFTGDVVTNDPSSSPSVRRFTLFLAEHPNANLLVGASSRTYLKRALKPSRTARRVGNGVWMESHNSALMLDAFSSPEIFHKSKLVVGVEMTPYPAVFCKVDDWLGGVMGRCIGQRETAPLHFNEYVAGRAVSDSLSSGDAMMPDGPATAVSVRETVPVGCAVCYESVYGEYCTQYVRNGARLLTVITNDAWWGDTPGYRQHLAYSCLRAIETRRWIARSANTGISAIIDPSGKVVSHTSWWQPAVLKGKVGLNDGQTFFVIHGDFIGRLSTLMAVLILLATLVRRFAR